MVKKMVFATLILGSFALVILLSSIKYYSSGIIDAVDGGQFLNSSDQVLDFDFTDSSSSGEDQTSKMVERDNNNVSRPKMTLTFFDNSTASSVCNQISGRQVLVIMCTLTSSYQASLIAEMDDFTTEVPTPCCEPDFDEKAKLEATSSVLYMIRHTSREVSCFSALISSIKYWQKAFYEEKIFPKYQRKSIKLNLSSLVTHSRTQKFSGLIQTYKFSGPAENDASRVPLVYLKWKWFDDIECKAVSVGTENTFHEKLGCSFPCAGNTDAVVRIGVPMRSNITQQFVSVNNDENPTTRITWFSNGYIVPKTQTQPSCGIHASIRILPRCDMTRRKRSAKSDPKRTLSIGIPMRSSITQIVSVNKDENHTTHITGLSTDVFEAAVRYLPYDYSYKLIPFNGSSDELVKEVVRKTYDVGVVDSVIPASQGQPVKFSLRYLESLPYLKPGFMMVVRLKTNELNNFWWFLSPFTPKMWIMIAAFNVLIGAVIWIIETRDENGPNFLDTLFFINRQPLQNNAARILSILWVFVLLILTQVYISMLTSMLTDSQRKPDVNSLKSTNAAIGCDGQSQTIDYLIQVLGFKRGNIWMIDSMDEYADALTSGKIKALFLLTPYAKVFLAKYCAEFTEIKPTYADFTKPGYSLGGFGFVFPNDSYFASDISTAILELDECGELQLMEEAYFSNCSMNVLDDPTIRSIGPSTFHGLFVVFGVIWAIILFITLIKLLGRQWERCIQKLWTLWLRRMQWNDMMARLLMLRQISTQ